MKGWRVNDRVRCFLCKGTGLDLENEYDLCLPCQGSKDHPRFLHAGTSDNHVTLCVVVTNPRVSWEDIIEYAQEIGADNGFQVLLEMQMTGWIAEAELFDQSSFEEQVSARLTIHA